MPGLFCSIQFNFIFLHIQFYIHRSTITCRCKRNCCIIKYCTRYFTLSIPAPFLMAGAFTSFTLPSSATAIPGLLLPILSCTIIYLALACFTALFTSSPKIRQVNIQAVLLSFSFCPRRWKPLLNWRKLNVVRKIFYSFLKAKFYQCLVHKFVCFFAQTGDCIIKPAY